MQYNPQVYRYPSRRTMVYAKRGMVCTSTPLAAQAGLDILKKGGNAIDAAVAAAAALTVLEPTSNGIGGDAFALVWTRGKLHGLNASGYSPAALHGEMLRAQGLTEVPKRGWEPVMVPGAPGGWAELVQRYGSMPLSQVMEPAAWYAEHGYPVSPDVSYFWNQAVEDFTKSLKGPVFEPWFDTFAAGGRAPKAGQLWRSPQMGATLREIGRTNAESLYRGALAEKILQFSQATGGYLERADLSGYRPEWVEPITTHYKGYDVYEIPPNGHGITVLMALNILKGLELGREKESVQTYHQMIEAMKLAFVDAKAFVADPRYMKTKVEDMLSDRYADTRRSLIRPDEALLPHSGDPASGDTVYLCTADDQGNMVSYIQSNYGGFGSGVVVPGTGIALQNRGNNFSLDPRSDNYLTGRKKAYHTIIPGFLAKEGQPVGPFGVMGGFMQPQGHLQVLVNAIDYGMNPQECLDAPRFQWTKEKSIQLDATVPTEVAEGLAALGHDISIDETPGSMGRGQIIWRTEDGMLAGGTEPRCDGSVAAY